MNVLAPPRVATLEDIDGRYAWQRLAVSVLLATIGGVGMWAVIVVLPAVQVEFGVDRGEASLPYTVTMVGFALGNIAVGRAIDRFGYVVPTAIATVALGIGFVLASMATTLTQFALIQGVLVGVGCSTIFGPLMADISHWFLRRRAVAVSLAASGNYLAGAFWPLAMSPLTEAYGWRGTYVVIGVLCLATMLPLLLLLRRKPPAAALSRPPSAATNGGGAVGLSPATLQLMLVIAGLSCCMAMSMPQVHIVAYCVDLGYGMARGTEMLSIMLAAGVASRVVSGFLADRIGGVRTLLIGSVLQCLALFLYIPFDGLASLYVVSLIFGLSQGGIVPCYAVIVREYMPASEAGQRVGIVVMATVFGMAIGGWMTGWIYDLTGSYAVAFLNGIGWNVLNIAIAGFLLWRGGRRIGVGPVGAGQTAA